MSCLFTQVREAIEAIKPEYDGDMLPANVFPLMGNRVVMVTPKHLGIPSAMQRMRANQEWIWLRQRLQDAGFKVQTAGQYSPHMLEVSL